MAITNFEFLHPFSKSYMDQQEQIQSTKPSQENNTNNFKSLINSKIYTKFQHNNQLQLLPQSLLESKQYVYIYMSLFLVFFFSVHSL